MSATTNDPLVAWLHRQLGEEARIADAIQTLWSGYGEVVRVVHSTGTAVLKRVEPPSHRRHPLGWSSDRGHQRKLRSYDVELTWYREYAPRCSERCRVPKLLAAHRDEDQWWFLLEDIDAAGFPRRAWSLDEHEIHACLSWLAYFHAEFLGEACACEPLWPTGTYWHLATRPDELAAMPDGPLKRAARAIDDQLDASRFRTLVHGDAKVANFCFPRGPVERVAAVDFQYAGGGVGPKDLVYFLGSILDDHELERTADDLVDVYFRLLEQATRGRADFAALEADWRRLVPFAWADFERFLAGWSPSHRKRTGYAARMTALALDSLRD